MPRINEQALKKELAKRGFESVSIKRELPGRRVKVDANKLYPVQVEGGEAIYAPKRRSDRRFSALAGSERRRHVQLPALYARARR